jgi:hypothetical protein
MSNETRDAREKGASSAQGACHSIWPPLFTEPLKLGKERSMKRRFWLITTLLFVSVLLMVGSEKGAVVSSAAVADLTCASSMTLESLATCICHQMPKAGSNGLGGNRGNIGVGVNMQPPLSPLADEV